jgi:cyclophilin family peptidyl-prolyl cis-trans isomerase
MEKDSALTYGIIALLILFLGGIAYTLQPSSNETTEVKNLQALEKKDTPKIVQTEGTLKTDATTTKKEPTKNMDTAKYTTAVITTNKGVIEVSLSQDKPLTVKNFGTLASSNFYDGVRFHRVIKGFMIQAGDPLSKDIASQSAWGTGGPGYKFQDELTGKEQYPLGTLAMANSGPNTNGSQFFIVTANPGVPLPPSYTVFGKVTKGLETALSIENVKTGPSDRPVEDVIIQSITVK